MSSAPLSTGGGEMPQDRRRRMSETASWKEATAEWLFSQGTSTVLLVMILFGGAYAAKEVVPQHLDSIKSGYRESHERFSENLKQVTETYKAESAINKAADAEKLQLIRDLYEENKEIKRKLRQQPNGDNQ